MTPKSNNTCRKLRVSAFKWYIRVGGLRTESCVRNIHPHESVEIVISKEF
jgi:hypothetical protein